MRIAMLATSRHPVAEPYAGGQESHTALLARGLRELGHHVRMYAPAGSDPGVADELVPYRGLPDLSAVAALDPQLPEPDFLRDHAAFTAAVVDLLARPVDVVHNQSLNFLPLAFSPAVAAPLVTTLHTPPSPGWSSGSPWRARASSTSASAAPTRQTGARCPPARGSSTTGSPTTAAARAQEATTWCGSAA